MVPNAATTAMTGAERLRRFRERKRQERGPTDPSPAAVIDALRKENAALRRQQAAKPAPAQDDELIDARAEIERLRQIIHDYRYRLDERREAAAKRKAAKPPLDPDSEAARQIKGLKTRVQTLTRQLAHANKKHGHMTFKTVSLISKALHSDTKPTDEDREEALKAFNAWKSDRKASAR